jgi:hypothetical protein
MRPARIIAAVALATAVAATGSYLAISTTTPSISSVPTTSGRLARKLRPHRQAAAWSWTGPADLDDQPVGRPARARPLRHLGAAGIDPGQ